MKRIDLAGVAFCLYVLGMMVYFAIRAMTDREVKIECIRKGGSIVRASGDVACQLPQVKP